MTLRPTPEDWSTPAGTAETHISVVLFVGDRAYKLLKPVRTGFLDHTSREARATACAREVALNRRLAPDVYLGVGVVGGPDDAEPCVVMRRMPADRRLAALLDRPDAAARVREVAAVVAAFHRDARRPPDPGTAAGPAAVRGLWSENLAEMRQVADGILDPRAIDEAEALCAEYLAGRGPLIETRIAAGRVVDGHGDLLADDVFCLDDGPRILDCLAFSDHLRAGDALADIAFLAMDLEHRGHPELARVLLETHAEETGDRPPPSLVRHWIAYRASVRAKVACYRASQGDPGAAARARGLLGLCLSHLRAARVRLVLVGGGPGVGKSTLASALAPAIEAEWIQSDAVRKDLAGLPAAPLATPPGLDEGLYAPEGSERVYAEMLRRAGAALAGGRSVVADASWAAAADRAAARRVAAAHRADLHELACTAPDAVADARIAARRRGGESPSDATALTAAHLRARREAWPEALAIDCATPPETALAAALAAVTSPAGSLRAAGPGT